MTNSMTLAQNARLGLVLAAAASLAACATPRYPSRASGPDGSAPAPGQGGYKVGAPYQVGGVWYVPKEDPNYDRTGVASWYGSDFHQKATANGELFDMNVATAAHTTLPLPSMVEVTNLDNGRKLMVRVNDRGPFVGNRIIDLSQEAARQLGYERAGLANVRVRYVGPAPLLGPDAGVRYASSKPLPTRMASAASSAVPAAARTAAVVPPAADPMAEWASAPVKAAPGVVAVSEAPLAPLAPVASKALPPLTGSQISDAPIGAVNAAPVATATATASAPIAATPSAVAAASPALASALRVQAGAFTSEVNAQRAVSALSAAGAASIEPVQRDGLTLYRVILPAPADEAGAYALRDRVAGFGFADARVVRTF